MRVGDAIVTGEGRSFHSGVPIGSVVSIERGDATLYQTAVVKPAVDLTHSTASSSSRTSVPRQQTASSARRAVRRAGVVRRAALAAGRGRRAIDRRSLPGDSATSCPASCSSVVVWYAIRVDAPRAALFGLVAGLCEDVLARANRRRLDDCDGVDRGASPACSRADFLPIRIPLVCAIDRGGHADARVDLLDGHGLRRLSAGIAGQHFHQALLEAALNVAVMLLAMLLARRFETQPRVIARPRVPGARPGSARSWRIAAFVRARRVRIDRAGRAADRCAARRRRTISRGGARQSSPPDSGRGAARHRLRPARESCWCAAGRRSWSR